MWKYSKYLSLKNKLYFKPLSQVALRRSKFIITCSQPSLIELKHYFHSLNDRIYSISAALPATSTIFQETSGILNKLNLPKQYILSVSSLEPRKNIPFLLQSIAPLLIKRNISIVLTGRKAWGNSAIEKTISSIGISSLIVTPGYVTENELQYLYTHAKVFIYPSLYEGFGFPILEAFAYGCPVITSNTSSMPEVAGDAAILVDPTNPDEIRNAVISLLENPTLCNNLIQKGKNRLKLFSWEKSANKLIEIIENAS
jgi:glycosyltransferase involved in cell wall biosynthesis